MLNHDKPLNSRSWSQAQLSITLSSNKNAFIFKGTSFLMEILLITRSTKKDISIPNVNVNDQDDNELSTFRECNDYKNEPQQKWKREGKLT